ncbi:MAG: P1 family peptidase [Anaerolineae bacterium]|nr:P1 family peptidase [Anaerolineae bacterium]
MNRKRLRDLGIVIGALPTGRWNAITDVPGVRVGQTTIITDEPRIARTGVTVIVPRDGDYWADHCFAGYHRFNGNGEMTGLMWVDEAGILTTPIGITNTHQVGIVRDVIVEYGRTQPNALRWILPVVAETYDGVLNDIDAFFLQREHVWAALETARSGPVDEGNVGGGTGMRCHQFKGGIGTSSRLAPVGDKTYTVGVLVQANYGSMEYLHIDRVPVGRGLMARRAAERQAAQGSIIIIIATDAPLLPIQCRRLAQRATVGLAHVGGYGDNSSGDLFFAFATGNHVPRDASELVAAQMVPHDWMNNLFHAVAEAVEESILNALTAAETMRGFRGEVEALPLDETLEIMRRHGRLK